MRTREQIQALIERNMEIESELFRQQFIRDVVEPERAKRRQFAEKQLAAKRNAEKDEQVCQ
jgi:hypothetical protein